MLLPWHTDDIIDDCACRMFLLSLQELGETSCIALIPCHDVTLGESKVDKDVVCGLVLPLRFKGSPSVVNGDAENEDDNDDDCRVLVP